jgi:WD40 repeat protein/cellulose biosynthesis protein BcsQ
VKKLLIASQKSGVGKTTSAINLATAAALSGIRTLLVDADPLNCIGAALNLEAHIPAPGLAGIGVASKAPLWQNVVPNLDVTSPYGTDHKPIHSLDELLILLHEAPAFRRYQLIIFDTPNFLGGGQLRNLIRVSDEILLVIRAEPLAFQAIPNFTKLVRGVQEEGSPVRFRGLLLTLPPNEPLGGPWETELRQVFVTQLLPHAIPYDPAVQASLDARKPLLIFQPQAVASRQYAKLAQHLGLASNETDQVDLFHTPPSGLPRLPQLQRLDEVPKASLSGAEVRQMLGEPIPEIMESLSSIMEQMASKVNPNNDDTDRIRPIPVNIRPIEEQQTGSDSDIFVVSTPNVTSQTNASVNTQHSERKMNSSLEKTPRGHTGDVTSVAFSPDGLTLATASWDKTVKLWNVSLGQERLTLRGHGGVVSSIAFVAGQDWLASASWDKTIRLWQVSDGKPGIVLSGHSGVVTAVAFGPKGEFLVSGGWDRTVRVWDPKTGHALAVLEGHSRMVTSVAVSRDGKWIASGSWDKTARLWPRAGGPAKILTGHTGDVSAVDFSPNGSLLASCSLDHTIHLWDVARGQEMALLRGHGGEVTSVAFSPDGHWLASTGWDKSVKIWDVSTGQVKLSLLGHTSVVTSVAFSPDGRFVASSSLDRTVRIWDITLGQEVSALPVQLNNDSRPNASFNPRETPSKIGPSADEINAHLAAVAKQTPVNAPRPNNLAEGPKVQPSSSHLPSVTPTTISDGQVDLSAPPITPLLEDIFPRVQSKPSLIGGINPTTLPPAQPSKPTLDLGDLPENDNNSNGIQIIPENIEVEAGLKITALETPEIPVPEVKIPEVKIPETKLPEIHAPEIKIPEIKIPEIEAPTIKLPEVKIPDIQAPEIQAPEVKLTEIKVPEIQPPELKLPEVKIPEVASPKVKYEMPRLEANLHLLKPNSDSDKTSPLQVQAPTVGTGELEVPKVELPSIKLPEVELPEIKPPSMKVPEVKLPELSVPEIKVPTVELPKGEQPAISIPELNLAAEGTLPPMKLPEVKLPELVVPEVKLPELVVPEVKLPELVVPEAKLPEVKPSTTTIPSSETKPTTEAPDTSKKTPIKLPDMRLNKGNSSPSKLSSASIPRPDLTKGLESSLPPNFGVILNTEELDEASIDFGYVPPPQLKSNMTQMSPSADLALPIPPEHLPKPEVSPPPKKETPPEVAPMSTNEPKPLSMNEPKPVKVTPAPSAKPQSGPLLSNKTPVRTLELPTRGSAFSAMSYSHDGSNLAVARGDSTILVFSVVTGELLQPLRGHAGDVHGTAFSPDGRLLASVGADTTIRIWELATGSEIRRFNGHLAQVVSVAFSPDGSRLASSSWDKTIKIWDWRSSFETKTLTGHTDGVASIAFSSDGRALVSGGEDGTVRLWDLQTGKETLNLRGSSREICAVTFSPDNDRIASAGGEGSIKVWEVATGEEILTIVAHSRVSSSLAFSPDSTMIVSGGWDHLVRVWNATNGHPIQLLRGHKAEVTGVAFSVDGKGVISSGWDRTLRFWDIYTGIQTSTLSDDGLKPTELAVAKGLRMTPPPMPRPMTPITQTPSPMPRPMTPITQTPSPISPPAKTTPRPAPLPVKEPIPAPPQSVPPSQPTISVSTSSTTNIKANDVNLPPTQTVPVVPLTMTPAVEPMKAEMELPPPLCDPSDDLYPSSSSGQSTLGDQSTVNLDYRWRRSRDSRLESRKMDRTRDIFGTRSGGGCRGCEWGRAIAHHRLE